MRVRGFKPVTLVVSFVGLVALLNLGVVLAGCLNPDTAQFEDHGIVFDKHELVIGPARRQTVLTGSLLGGTFADLAVVDNDRGHLRLYAFADDTWAPKLDVSLGPEVLFVDVGNIGGQDRLITYERGRLNWFDPASATKHAMIAVRSDFEASAGEIPHVEITRDVNGDGRDDLVVPQVSGFAIYLQMERGAFSDPINLGPSSTPGWNARNNPWLQSLLHEFDYDRDGRTDLLFWKKDHFEAHRQTEHGRFDPVAQILRSGASFGSVRLDSLSTEEQDAGGNDPKKKALSTLEDLNGDGLADLAIVSTEGSNPLNFTSVYEAHFGIRTPRGGIAFASKPNHTIRWDGVQFGRRHQDFDGDGQVDLMTITANDLGVFKMAGGYMSGSMKMDLEFYRMEDGVYPEKPNATRKIKGIFNADSYYQAVLLSDINGDGRLDLLVQKEKEELRIFVGIPGPGLFASRCQRLEIAMPDNERDTRLVDLNKDGKDDLLMHHRFTDCYWRTTDIEEPHRITMLIAR